MLINESRWIKRTIEQLDVPAHALALNFGSQRYAAIKKNQPWIIENVYASTSRKFEKVINFDLFPGDGVDIHGDIFEPSIFDLLKNYHFQAIFVFNVLEHVENLTEICARIGLLLDSNDYLIITVPRKYPRHNDPIDNNFRPHPQDLEKLFPDFVMVSAEVTIEKTFIYYLMNDLRKAIKYAVRILLPFYNYRNWKTQLALLPYLFKHFEVTCVLMKKK